ncbi:hypothetical protein [Nitrospirillum pindoramense]|uniref:hypothetical protein n=1 Tax=Nitrospirillum amazonense TaxID=28077 RepID=UPI0011AAD8A0|nr:hypothetical protein [Nitrospirillum amazonense]
MTRSAIVAQGKVYPLADIAELDVQVPGIPGALYSAGPSVVAGGSGEMGAVVLSSSLAAATTLRTTVAVAGAMRGIENARSLSLNLRLRGQDKPVVLAQGLTAGPAQALLEAVVDATKG